MAWRFIRVHRSTNCRTQGPTDNRAITTTNLITDSRTGSAADTTTNSGIEG
jgi:hypothetical protein